MSEQRNGPPEYSLVAVGVLMAAGGLYFALAGLGAVPMPSKLNGPNWMALCVGAVFFFGGVSATVHGAFVGSRTASDLPADTPRWIRMVYWFSTMAICLALSTMGTWVAFGPGERGFTMAGAISGPIGDGIGRAAFGLGAIICWFITAAFARAGLRKIFGR
ncbi:MAG: hypothetical protein ACK4UO_13770 [Pseudolabrys sp.]